MKMVFAALCDSCEESAEKGRHNSAETILGYSTAGGFDSAIGGILKNLAYYADCHHSAYSSPVANDGVLGEAWENSLRGLRALLNGETGRLDCGDVDHAILAMHKAAGFTGEL